MTENSFLLKNVLDHVAVLTLNRPDEMNSLSHDLFLALTAEMKACDGDDEIRAVVLTGAGNKAFCAGIDLKERGRMSEAEVLESRAQAVKPCFDAFQAFTKPVICAVNGAALGGGAELALASDIRLAVPHARFAHPEIKWGMIPAAGAHQRLRNLVGLGMAKEIIYTGRTVKAAEAYKLGIYNHLMEASDLIGEARSMAQTIARHAPLAVRQSKRVFDEWAYDDAAFEFEYEASKACYEEGSAMAGPGTFESKSE